MRLNRFISHWTTAGDHYIVHCDGSVSAIAELDGYDIYMSDDDAATKSLEALRHFIDCLPLEVSVEFHLQRRRDTHAVDSFKACPVKRMARVLTPLRQKYIEHIRDYLFVNRIYLVLQWHGSKRFHNPVAAFSFARLERELRRIPHACTQLQQFIEKSCSSLAGFSLLDVNQALRFLYRSAHYRSCELLPDSSYLLRDILAPSGEARNGFYVMNGVQLKPFLIYLYPEPDLRIVTDFMASLPIELDISLYLRRRDYSRFLRKSGGEEVRQERQLSSEDVESEKRLADIAAWRRHVVNNGLQIFNNVFYLKLFGKQEEIEEQANDLLEQLAALGAVVESERLVDYAMIYTLPANMYQSAFKRQDHTEMVLSLLPVVKFHQGNGYQEAIAATNFTFTGFDYTNQTGGEFYHSLTIAKTGSGKGVLNCARIIQLYGLGYDFYAIEIGNTYEFLFRLLGGNYVTIDPDSSVINPFPLCAEVGSRPSSTLVAPTIKSLARILTDGRMEMSVHETSVCEMTFKSIYQPAYLERHKIKEAPHLGHFYTAMALLDEKNLNDKQKYARDTILKNVQSFLATIIGERFKAEDNLNLSGSLFAADFKRLKDEPQLLVIYLTFLSLRYGQKALFRRTPTFIVIDELHEFMRADRDTIRTLCVQIARMGRKERGYINLITQEIDDIAQLDSSLVNQMFITNLLYTETRHQKASEHFASLNERALTTWSNYQQYYSGYRAGLIGFGGHYTDAFLTYPKEILALADTRGEMLERKKELMNRYETIEAAYEELLQGYA